MNVVILAAGMGKRMQSSLPKVLHTLAGKPLLNHVIATARQLQASTICVIYGHGGEQVPTTVAAEDLRFALQEPQLGTGHAVAQALPVLDINQATLVLYGDVPLTTPASLARLIAVAGKDKLGILTVDMADPTGLGRIVREDGIIKRIVEQKDASETERQITETNTGIMSIPTAQLQKWLGNLSNKNAQGEYYLTDIVALARAAGMTAGLVLCPEAETMGVNTSAQLAEAEAAFQARARADALEAGVTLTAPIRSISRWTR